MKKGAALRKQKKQHAAVLVKQQAMAAKMELMLREPRPKTWSARMPAYCYTELCVDPGLRMHPADVERMKGGNAQ